MSDDTIRPELEDKLSPEDAKLIIDAIADVEREEADASHRREPASGGGD